MRLALASVLCLSLASACQEETLGTTPPPAVDVSGAWLADWEQEETQRPALAGQMTLSFIQDSSGAVTGVVSFEGLECLLTYDFNGEVTGLTFTGTIDQDDVQVSFEVDARAAQAEEPRLSGCFVIDVATDCAGFEANFDALLQFPPEPRPEPGSGGPQRLMTDGSLRRAGRNTADAGSLESSPQARMKVHDPEEPAAAWSMPPVDLDGSWLGRCDELDGHAPAMIRLELDQAPGGRVDGVLALEQRSPLPLSGVVRGTLLIALSADARRTLILTVDAGSRMPTERAVLVGECLLESSATAEPRRLHLSLERCEAADSNR